MTPRYIARTYGIDRADLARLLGTADTDDLRLPLFTIAQQRDIPTADESMVVIRFAKPKGIDFQYLLNMINGSWMSRANTIVVPGGKMELAMQLIFTPFVWRMMERKRRAMGLA